MKERIFNIVAVIILALWILSMMIMCVEADSEESLSNKEDELIYLCVAEPIPIAEPIVIEFIDVVEESHSAPYAFLSLDDDLQVYLEQSCNEHGIDFFLAAALMRSESDFDPEAVGDNGNSIGLFQINKVWWETMSNRGIDVFTPKGNIDAGIQIIEELQARFPDDIDMVIQCYKCGLSRGTELAKEGIKLSIIDIIKLEADEYKESLEKSED